MKKLTWLLVLGTIVAIPIILLTRKDRTTNDDLRYDINDYITEEGL